MIVESTAEKVIVAAVVVDAIVDAIVDLVAAAVFEGGCVMKVESGVGDDKRLDVA